MVSAKILGGGVHDDIGTEFKRALPNRRRPCVIDHAQCPRLMGYFAEAGDIRNIQARVGGRLQPNQFSVGAHSALDMGGVGHRHKIGSVSYTHLTLPTNREV